MIRALELWLLAGLFALLPAQQPAAQRPGHTPAEQAIADQLREMRNVPDGKRGPFTLRLALDIRALPNSPRKVSLAYGLANLSTEGDFGRETLAGVALTLAAALRESPAPAGKDGKPAGPYLTLAQFALYESIPVSLDDPSYTAALRHFRELDKVRAQADFTLSDLKGKQWHLRGLRGQVVLVNFWATWCPPCRKEMPDLEALFKKHQKKGLVVLALSDEDSAKVNGFLEAQRYTFPVLLDPRGAAARTFGVDGIPKSFLFDREGKLVAQAIDMRTRRQFEAMLKQAGL